ncbi:MAG: CinA family protein [Alphaproteobacteria bacterium]|nr:CinA family protein [Alphaproteobacteria bacterium]
MLDRDGSVNENVARQRASGALDCSHADLALAITGVLGPEPDEDGNPVGLVYLACAKRSEEPRVLRRDYGQQPHEVLLRTAIEDALALVEDCALDAPGKCAAPNALGIGHQ